MEQYIKEKILGFSKKKKKKSQNLTARRLNNLACYHNLKLLYKKKDMQSNKSCITECKIKAN